MLKRKPKTTPPYITAILEAVEKGNNVEAMQKLQDAAIDYYGRINAAQQTIPIRDAAIIIKLHRHIASELERNDPVAAALAKTLEPIDLPPINYTRRENQK